LDGGNWTTRGLQGSFRDEFGGRRVQGTRCRVKENPLDRSFIDSRGAWGQLFGVILGNRGSLGYLHGCWGTGRRAENGMGGGWGLDPEKRELDLRGDRRVVSVRQEHEILGLLGGHLKIKRVILRY
jgi:hypothetical protein